MAPGSDLHFSDFLKEKNIVCGLSATTWMDAITELITLLDKNGSDFEKKSVINACFERERATSTVLTPGLALPHARVEELDSLLVAVGTSQAGIVFPDEERGLVNVVIVVLTPKTDPGLYLQALAALSKDLGSEDAPKDLAACTSTKKIYRFFSHHHAPLPPFLKAKDLMDSNPVTLLESDMLKKAIDVFCSKHVIDIPIIDEEGDLRGVLEVEDLLKLSLPEHLLWMNDLSPILRFEPFAEVLRDDQESKVADFMRDATTIVKPDLPAIQLAKIFLTDKARQILVVDGRKLLGTVNLSDFTSKVFWA